MNQIKVIEPGLWSIHVTEGVDPKVLGHAASQCAMGNLWVYADPECTTYQIAVRQPVMKVIKVWPGEFGTSLTLIVRPHYSVADRPPPEMTCRSNATHIWEGFRASEIRSERVVHWFGVKGITGPEVLPIIPAMIPFAYVEMPKRRPDGTWIVPLTVPKTCYQDLVDLFANGELSGSVMHLDDSTGESQVKNHQDVTAWFKLLPGDNIVAYRDAVHGESKDRPYINVLCQIAIHNYERIPPFKNCKVLLKGEPKVNSDPNSFVINGLGLLLS